MAGVRLRTPPSGIKAEAPEASKGPGEPAGDSQGSASTVCACAGNCGGRECKSRVNKRRSNPGLRICEVAVSPGQRFCSACKCELVACQRPRSRVIGCGSKRWCLSCGRKAECADYSNVNGIFPFHQSFTPTLRVVARVAWLFQRMLPLDLISMVELWGAQVPMLGAGSPVAPDALVVLLFAHAF